MLRTAHLIISGTLSLEKNLGLTLGSGVILHFYIIHCCAGMPASSAHAVDTLEYVCMGCAERNSSKPEGRVFVDFCAMESLSCNYLQSNYSHACRYFAHRKVLSPKVVRSVGSVSFRACTTCITL